ncbi:MAG: hypothetical protein ACKVPJ_10045 [Chitinophagales bacterium]
MASWVLKAIIQKGISFLPFRHQLNYLFQKHVTRGVRLTDKLFESKLLHCKQHLTALFDHSKTQSNFSALELGTGWYPVVPIGFFLAGAEKIYTADIKSTVTKGQFEATIIKYISYADSGRLKNFLPGILEERLNILRNLLLTEKEIDTYFEDVNVTFLEGDIIKQIIPGGSIHLISSNNTFEHIPELLLKKILSHFKTLIHPGGVMSHFIDMSDHFSHLDKTISNYHFLRFSDRQWGFIDNSIQPQNRLRINHYRELLQSTGWVIVSEEMTVAQPDRTIEIKISKQFSSVSHADLIVTHVLLTCKPE